ncbi:MAG: LytTR family DNA-binding domain-containing protein [Lachnospiraceae bacterium]|nr:LytTR family DNA-binding domain-containing protein [Lachnospiraceae bacterium]
MLQIGICDDEPLLLNEIKVITEDCLQRQQAFSILSTYTDGRTLLYEIQDGKRFDLLLLDIEMPDLSGMELAEQIHNLLPDALMIFVTAHYKYAVDAYALHIFRYIPKNQLKERLPHALKDAVALLEIQNTDSFIISNHNLFERIPLRDILYIEKDGKNALFHTTADENQTNDSINPARRLRKTLTEVFDELNSEEFYFIERGFIVNLRHVTGISHNDCILTDRTRLPISQSRLAEFKKKLNLYWKNKV